MFHPQSPEDAVSMIKSGDRVFIQTACAAPYPLIQAMCDRKDDLRNVEIISLHTEGPAPYAEPDMQESFRVNALFIGKNVRKAVNDGRGDYIPIFLSEVPLLFRRNVLPIDVALIQVSPPDKHGFCSLGISVDTTLAAIEVAEHVIAVVNPKMPRTHGEGIIHISRINAFVEDESDICELRSPEPNKEQTAIGEHIAELIDDGATLQTGIGAIPDAVLNCLENHKDLGVHSEMFSDGIVKLAENGVLSGKYKKKHHGVIVGGFAMGTRKLYDFMDDNPMVRMLDIAYVNKVDNIARNHKMTAINSAIEVDLTGQVVSDSIGRNFYSGVGGQMDFIRGAALCENGKAIIALPSRTSKGKNRIVSSIQPGAGVVTTRAHVHFVATEYGIVDLFGLNIRQRARALINIAHPDDREQLGKELFETHKILI